MPDQDDALSTDLRRLLGAERDFAAFVEQMKGEVIDRDFIATLAVERERIVRRMANLEHSLELMGADTSPLPSVAAHNLLARSLADPDGVQTRNAPDWLYAVTARKFEEFKIAEYSRLVRAASEKGNEAVGRLLEENLEQEEHLAVTLDSVVKETVP